MPHDDDVRPTTVVAEARPVLDAEAEIVAVPVFPGHDGDPTLSAVAAEVAEALDLDLRGALDRAAASGKAGEVVPVPVFASGRGAGSVDGEVDVTRVLLVGVGDGSPAAYRIAGAGLARAARGCERVASAVTAAGDAAAQRAFVEGVVLATYALAGYRGRPVPARRRPAGTVVVAGSDHPDAVETAARIAAAAWAARDLVHTPSNVKSPAWLAERAGELGRAAGLDVRVLDDKALAAGGFGGILAVGQGSPRPPRLVVARYAPPDPGTDAVHVVLIGKGITYDTGGLSLKPREAMVPMKTDMTGAAVVAGVMSALAALDVPVRVTGLLAVAENMPGAAAQRPGDVIRQYDGTTVEVVNTDAEGRLVLADAIGYAVAELEPDALVDVATLTGAATVGLGKGHAALFGTDDALLARLREAGESAGEPLWPMPLVDDYRPALSSEVADLCHVTTVSHVGGGSITAALFLERFVRDVPWAHLDIAGPARSDGDRQELVKGGTAFGVRALLYWLERGAPGVARAVPVSR